MTREQGIRARGPRTMAVAAFVAVSLALTGVGVTVAATSPSTSGSGHGEMSQMMQWCCGQADASGHGSM